ncbi:MAG: electron transfer flavoprotein beta subunit [Blastocatellia bacterium]|nr:electron transfer flavoprotein beta subunit [Blastocatellia bacterium]
MFFVLGTLSFEFKLTERSKNEARSSKIRDRCLTMKILVLMKQVANKDAILRINKDSTWIEEADLSFEVSESDGYALEEALRIKEQVSGEVVVCSMGPQRAKSVIKDALSRGADRAIHVLGDNVTHLSPFAAASVLAEAIREEQADLIMTGLQSDDYGYGQTGVILAEILGLPHATIVIEIDATGGELRVKRELESGWYQWYTMPTPALLTIQSGISQIRYATLKGIMAAKKKEIKEVTPNAEIVSRPSHQRIEKIYLPQKSKQTQFLGGGDARKGAVELAEKLRTEARVI